MQHCVLNDIFACTAVSLFFKERRVFGLIYSFGTGRLGSVLNLNLTGRLYSALSFLTDRNMPGLAACLAAYIARLACAVCTSGLIVGFIATLLHYKREKVLR